MPPYVDHDQRRHELAEVAANLVATGGAEAATVRAIANAGGFSTKVVSHYFADKRALMLATYAHAASRAAALTEASQPPGGADVRAFLRALLPISDEAARNWRVWFAFWGRAIADGELAAEQQARAAQFVERIDATLAADPAFTDLAAAVRQSLAARLFSTLVGIAMQAVFDPGAWPSGRQIDLLAEALATDPANSGVMVP